MKRPYRILLADDDPGVRGGLQEFLEGEGHRTYAARGGGEAVEIARRCEIDLTVLDVHMPDMTGFETLGVLRRLRVLVPCIFMSADDSEAVEEGVRTAGGIALVRKPIQIAHFRVVLHLAGDLGSC